MKASNKFRSTKTFSILGGDAHKIARIVAHFGSKLVSVSHEHKPKGSYDDLRTYVVRIIDAGSIVDVEVYCDSQDRVIENEREVVVAAKPDFSYSSRGGMLSANSAAARDWVQKNFLPERLIYGNAKLFVEPHSITSIIKKIEADKLSFLFV